MFLIVSLAYVLHCYVKIYLYFMFGNQTGTQLFICDTKTKLIFLEISHSINKYTLKLSLAMKKKVQLLTNLKLHSHCRTL